MSYLGIDGHERVNITAAAFYGRGAAAVLAAARAPARTAVESPGEEPAAKRPPSADNLRAFTVSPLAGPPQLWPYAGANFAGSFQPHAASTGPAAQSDGVFFWPTRRPRSVQGSGLFDGGGVHGGKSQDFGHRRSLGSVF